ncbi:MAG: hypothetical protein AAGC68_03740 [Verrucomicrobiota bacterium]
MSSLWKGPDHLVYVRGNGFLVPLGEEYKRYRFEDIEAFSIVRRSRIGLGVLHGVSLLFWLGVMLLLLVFGDENGFTTGRAIAVSFFALGALASLSLLIRHFILGPTCQCDIQTNLSRDRLRPLGRFHQAKELVDSLAEEIREVQSGFTAGVGEDRGAFPRARDKEQSFRFSVPSPVLPTAIGAIVFSLLGVTGLHLDGIVLPVILMLCLLALSFLLAYSLITSVRKPTPETIRTCLWVLLGLFFLFVGLSVVYLLFSVARDPAYSIGIMGPLEAFAGIAGSGNATFYLLFLFFLLGIFGVGIWTTLDVARWKGRLAEAEKSHSGRRESANEGGTGKDKEKEEEDG